MFDNSDGRTRFAGFFRMPDNSGKQYKTGWQPNASGETSTNWCGAVFEKKPWPNAVQSINALANNSGVAHARAPVPVNDQYTFAPENYLFIGGTIGKSRG